MSSDPETLDTLSQGIAAALTPAILQTDERIKALLFSQSELKKQISQLSQELSRYATLASAPNISPYAHKLEVYQQRIDKIHITIRQIQERLARLEKNYLRRV